MKVKRAIMLSILAYITVFLTGIAISVILEVDLTEMAAMTEQMWYASIAASVVIMALFSIWYFSGQDTGRGPKRGFQFGLMAVTIGFIFDAALMVPYMFMEDSTWDIVAYYTDPFFWTTIVSILATTTVVGLLKKNPQISAPSSDV